MPLTKITVTYGRTQSLPDYCNVRPSVTLEYTLEPGDDPNRTLRHFMMEAQLFIEEQCDNALEDSGRPAKFSSEPRYTVLSSVAPNTFDIRGQIKAVPPERIVTIVPDNLRSVVRGWGYTQANVYPSDGLRWRHAMRVAQQYLDDQAIGGIEYRLVECRTPDDLRHIPRAPEPEPEDAKTEPEQSEYMLSEHEPGPPHDEDDA